MKTTPTLFDIEDPVTTRSWQRVAPVAVEATEDDVTPVAGIALFGELLEDEATQRLRGSHALPSHTTLYRFLAGADLGRVRRAAAVNCDMLRRAWAMGAAPAPGILTIE
ncbi:MAG: hypothetical protein ACYCS7_07685 [Acidimicrobiales bacterium]